MKSDKRSMTKNLSDKELRILGALMEKELTTPEYYPLTINALLSACNQKSNRQPVMSLDIQDVESTLDTLQRKRLTLPVRSESGRTDRFRHTLDEELELSTRQKALLTILLLRGPQTPGELKTRTGRMCQFNSLHEIEQSLEHLENRKEGSLVKHLGRQPGQKERRYKHMLGEEKAEVKEKPAMLIKKSSIPHDRLDNLEKRVDNLQSDLDDLQIAFQSLMEKLDLKD